MKKSNLIILGCHSSIPTIEFHPTSQILEMCENTFLIDCGEGTQAQIKKTNIKINNISNIFISHLHGDHYFGLIGLISTYQLIGRKIPLNIYSPKGLKEIINIHFKWSKSRIEYDINYIELLSKKSEKIFENKKIIVYTIPLKHRISTNGFLFKEKSHDRNLNINAIKKYPEIRISDYKNIKKGNNFKLSNGNEILNSDITFDPPKSISYAFCSDTSYCIDIIKYIKNVNLLYHESTFLEIEKERAKKTGHSTAIQAAKIAKKANVKKLILGHYSNRFKDIKKFEKEAKKIFYNTEASEALKNYKIL